MRSRILDAIPLLALMAGIFILSHQPGDAIHLPAFPLSDKLLHATAYAALAASALFADRSQTQVNSHEISRQAFSALSLCILYGASDELHQSFIPFRDASLADLAADAVGAVIVVTCWFWRRNVMATVRRENQV